MSDYQTHPKPGTFTHHPDPYLALGVAKAEVERLTALGDAICNAARGVLAPNDNDIENDYGLPEACDKWEGR